MAGSIAGIAVIFNKYKYVLALSPSKLIDSSSFVVDFPNRKLVNVGLDPKDFVNINIIIITSSRHINIK